MQIWLNCQNGWGLAAELMEIGIHFNFNSIILKMNFVEEIKGYILM